MVPACTLTGSTYDKSCILKPGDHPFIVHDSFIDCVFARIEPASKLQKGIAAGIFVDNGPITVAVGERVLAAVKKSPFTKNFVKSFLNDIEKAGKK
jgi:hypothetical protein